MNIDIDNNDDYIFIFDTEKELYSHMKNKINPNNQNLHRRNIKIYI